MEKHFKLTKLKNSKLNKLRFILFLFLILFTITGLLTNSQGWKINLLGILIIICILTIAIAPVIFPHFIFIGDLIIGSKKIQIKEFKKAPMIYPIKELDKIEIKFRGTKSDSFPSAIFGIGVFGYKDGSGNKLQFEHLGKTKEVEFFSDHDMDFKALKRILMEIEKNAKEVSLVRVKY